MMDNNTNITMEQVEKLRQYGNINFQEAKSALEQANGNMLDAIIILENQGKIPLQSPGNSQGQGHGNQPYVGNDFNNSHQGHSGNCHYGDYHHYKNHSSFRSQMSKFWKWCARLLEKGNTNNLVVRKNSEFVTAIPLTVVVLLTLCFFWVTIPLLIIGLFLNYNYKFSGPDFDSCNYTDSKEGNKNGTNQESDTNN